MSARSLRQDFLRMLGGSAGVYLFGTAIASSLYQREDTAGLGRLVVASSFIMLLSTLCVAGCLWIFGETLLALAFGSDYRAAAPIMSVLAGASVAGAMAGISISLLHAGLQDVVVARACAVSLAIGQALDIPFERAAQIHRAADFAHDVAARQYLSVMGL